MSQLRDLPNLESVPPCYCHLDGEPQVKHWHVSAKVANADDALNIAETIAVDFDDYDGPEPRPTVEINVNGQLYWAGPATP